MVKRLKKELQKISQKQFSIEKVIKRKCNNLYVKLKGYNDSFNSWVNKKYMIYKVSYFRELHTRSKSKINVELELSNYATKSDLKNETCVDTSNDAEKSALARLKSDLDQLDIDQLEKGPSCLSNLRSKVDKLDIGKLETS